MELEQPTDEIRARFVEALNNCLPNTLKAIEHKIMGLVSEHTGVSIFDMQSVGRKMEHVKARQLSMYFIKNNSTYSLKAIGSMFNNRDHSTVIHAIESVENQRDTNKVYRKLFEEIEGKVKEIL